MVEQLSGQGDQDSRIAGVRTGETRLSGRKRPDHGSLGRLYRRVNKKHRLRIADRFSQLRGKLVRGDDLDTRETPRLYD
jgi:hypothetical protein